MSNHGKQHVFNLSDEQKQFQLERLILFSDAVFAIAITLLVIEIKVPEIAEGGNATVKMKHALLHMLPEFFGFILSFAVIGQFWTNHHKMFGYVKNFNGGLLWLNLFYLLWIVLVPFTSSLNSRYGNLDFIWLLYSLNLFMIAFSLWLLFRYIANPKHNLSDLEAHKIVRKYANQRTLAIAFIFLLGALLTIPGIMALSYTSRFIFFLIWPVISVINKRQQKENAALLKPVKPAE